MTVPTKPKISQIRDFIVEFSQLPNDTLNQGLALVSALPDPKYGAINLSNPLSTSGLLPIARILNFDMQVQTNRLDQLAIPITNVNLNNQRITNLQNPTVATDAVNKSYVDALIDGIVGGAATNNKREFFGGGISTYTLTNNPATNSEFIYVNGQLTRAGSLNDYTLVGTSLIFNYTTDPDDIVAVYYSLT